MKVKWQSDAPKMELVIPKGQYLPYELPVATKEVLGGVKVDGDTINITSDGVISAQKVDLSGVATKVELEEVENKIPDISGLATKSELATVESKIPDTSGLATKVELGEVMTSIPDVSGFATKTELNMVKNSIPDTSGLATKTELTAVENKIPDVSGLATKTELNLVENKIPSIEGLATKNELDLVENKIPDVSNFVIHKEMTDAITEVEGKIPDTSGLATKTELTEVENKIPDVSSFATKDEIPNVSGFATKVELNAVQSSIPDTSGLATKIELSNVEANIPDISGLATKVELSAVENKIPDVSGFATKDEIPNVSGLATKVELNEVAATIPSSDDLATKAELNAVQSSIPDTTGLATKSEVSSVEAKIPTTYLKSATVNNNKLTITNADDTSIEFTGGGSGGGGGVQLDYNIQSTATFTQQDKEVMKSAIKFGTGFTIDRCQVIRTIAIATRRVFIILKPNGATDNHVIGYQVDTDADKNVISSVFTKFIDYVLVGNNSAISGDIITSDNWNSYIDIPTSDEWIKADSNDDSNLYNAKQLWVIAMSGSSYYEGIFRFDYSYSTTILGDCTNVNFRLDDTFPFSYDGNSLNTTGGVIIAVYYKT